MDPVATTHPVTDTPHRVDGRTARSDRTKVLIIIGCRSLMLAGDFRPSAVAIAKASGVSVRSVFQHFVEIETVYREALDGPTRDAIAALIVPLPSLIMSPMVRENMANAAVFGRPLTHAAAD